MTARPEGVIKYSPNDDVRISGRVYYMDEKGVFSQLSWCYQFPVPPSPDIQSTLQDCIALTDPAFDSKKH